MPKRAAEAQDRAERFLRAFGGRLRETRQRRRLTQAKLAQMLGCAADMVGRYERGQGFPYGLNLATLAFKLDVTIDFLVIGRKVAVTVDQRLISRIQALEELPPEQLTKALALIDVFLKTGDTHPEVPSRRSS